MDWAIKIILKNINDQNFAHFMRGVTPKEVTTKGVTILGLRKRLLLYQIYPPNAFERRGWFFGHSTQLVLIIDQVFWTKGYTNAIELIEKESNNMHLMNGLIFRYYK